MIQLLKKEDQFNTTIFNGMFLVNKPVASGASALVSPYSNLFYWSHAVAIGDCEFGLHPHQGFEIMTFVLEGNVLHYDTATKVWTPLQSGDFQIIQSNRGVKHQERIANGTRSFQIWFDPNFHEAIKQDAAYEDYHSKDFIPILEHGIKTITYVGGNSKASAITPKLTIRRLFLDAESLHQLPLDKNYYYTFYVLSGNVLLDSHLLKTDDAIKIDNTEILRIEANVAGELFYIQTPVALQYQPIWELDI